MTPNCEPREVGFLHELPGTSRAKLLPLARQVSFPAGAKLIAEGSRTPLVYLIDAGTVRLEMATLPGQRTALASLGPGDLLGWSPMLGDGAMTSSAIALEPVTVTVFDGPTLRRLCEQDHEVGFHVMKQLAATLARRLVATRLQLLDLFSKSH